MERMRVMCWQQLRQAERDFNRQMITSMFDPQQLPQMTGADVVNALAENFDYFYILSQANTQSRRSRAGKEFELILALMLACCEIPVDMQFFLGTGLRKKAVDLVVPDLSTCSNSQQPQCMFALSAKTNLRERWQEVVTEAKQAQVKELYLLTLEPKVSIATIANLAHDNIFLVTSIANKQKWPVNAYQDHVLTFEELIQRINEALCSIPWSQIPTQTKQAASKYMYGLCQKTTDLPYVQHLYSTWGLRFENLALR
ncbi:MAG: hypothetical protein H9847_07515 [Candidatus Anaerobiospirillum pullicola]|uniref:Restriction endonuclease type II EcoRII C-terminal domain-containing protein n=1 Tax=Candidatus Anaerobiospirillum pullicola TaxID=2838451 RepID=A0A948X003_9GAMM|nr:hypothetical protein [Candidatus Anaerobiospirillum pullicola]